MTTPRHSKSGSGAVRSGQLQFRRSFLLGVSKTRKASAVEWWTASGSVPPTYVGQSVDKVGRTTGWTRGSVDATCIDVAVALDPSTGAIVPGVSYMVICADQVINSGVSQGDSGAPVWVTNAGTGSALQPVGILFAGAPQNQIDFSDGGTRYCTVACKYLFSNWSQLSNHLVRYFNPSP